jgi:hypothetical protein
VRPKSAASKIVAFAAGAVTIIGFLAPLSSVPAVADTTPATGPADAAHVSDVATASTIATTYKHNVVVDSQSSPTMLVQALPDGTMQAESDVVPARAAVNGVWTPIDTSLQKRSDGWLEPKVAAAGVRFGPGGSNQIAQVQSESGQWFSEAWPYGNLPAPTVDGSHALYPEVFPGVDLRLTATDAGMSEVLVVKTAQAAADPQLAGVTLAVQGATVQQNVKTRTLQAETTSTGDPVASATPLWWDSSSALSNADTPGGDEPQAVPTTSTSSSVSLNVNAVTATTPTYPVYIDPDWSSYLQADWYTDRAYPNQSYLDPPSDSVGYGISGGVGYLSHAFFQFTTDVVAHKHILNARFNIHQTYANSCDTTLVQLWEYGGSTAAGFTWNTEPNQWWYADDAQGNANGGPCAPNPAWVGFSATHAVTAAASTGQGNIQLGMRVANEANSLTRKHYDWNAQLIVTYNTPPANPASPTFVSPPRTCSSDSTKPVYINNGPTQPLKLQVTQSDVDGGGVNDGFYIYSATGTTILYSLGTANPSPQGAEQVQFSGGQIPPGAYRWNARAGDGIDLSAGYSPYCYFTVLNDGPDLPTISLPTLNAGDHYTVGSQITATIGYNGSQHVAMLALWWATGQTTTIPVTNTGAAPSCSPAPVVQTVRFVCPADPTKGTQDVTLAVPSESATLSVTAYDAAGNPVKGTPTVATKSVTAQADTTNVADAAGHHWETDLLDTSTPPTSVPDTNTTPINLSVAASSVWTNNGDVHGPSLTYPGSPTATTASSVVDTTKSFTVSAWLTPGTNTTTGTFTALSNGSGADSDFTLGIAGGKWQFCARVPGTPSTTKSDCVLGSAVTTNQPTFVTGTYDAANSLISIWFGTTAPYAYANHIVTGTPTPAGGGLLVGADRSSGSTVTGWSGLINNPSIYQGVATGNQLSKISTDIDPGSTGL